MSEHPCPFHEAYNCEACIHEHYEEKALDGGRKIGTYVCAHPLKEEYDRFLEDVRAGLIPERWHDAILEHFITGDR